MLRKRVTISPKEEAEIDGIIEFGENFVGSLKDVQDLFQVRKRHLIFEGVKNFFQILKDQGRRVTIIVEPVLFKLHFDVLSLELLRDQLGESFIETWVKGLEFEDLTGLGFFYYFAEKSYHLAPLFFLQFGTFFL